MWKGVRTARASGRILPVIIREVSSRSRIWTEAGPSFEFLPDLDFWSKESRERGLGPRHGTRKPRLMFCSGASSGDRVGVATPLCSVIEFVLEPSGLSLFLPHQTNRTYWLVGICLV